MGYNAIEQHDYDSSQDEDDDENARGPSSPRRKASPRPLTLPSSLGLFLDHRNTSPHKTSPNDAPQRHPTIPSIPSRSTKTNYSSYGMVEDDDFEDLGPAKQRKTSPPQPSEATAAVPLRIPNPRRRPKPATGADLPAQQPFSPSEPLPRTTSGCNIGLRHPTPDLQALQGAYMGNIENLEKTAERLSMTSSIEDAIRELHDEQKRSDSRRSSLISSYGVGPISRQVSNASSIVEVNSTARSGGFSPAGFLLSPKNSFTNIHGRGRSASKSSKFSRPEPEMEGRPLDSFNLHSPTFSGSDSIAEQDEDASTFHKPAVGQIDTTVMDEIPRSSQEEVEEERPVTSATEDLDGAFADFDGTHSEPLQPRSIASIPGGTEMLNSNLEQRRVSSGARLSMLAPRPQSYADPNTGQEMVYYPAPVPMMLNLPQKLSKNPSSMARNKRRSQVLSSIPPAARQSAIWLPDVLENEEDLPEDDNVQEQEYMPQHQRASMGGRRLTQDLSHMPPQLRASTYFDLPGSTQIVELKDQSAVATLDSILDASAHAPVSAFTDHAFAGTLGAEVYGRSHLRNSASTSQLLDKQPKKRLSSFNLLRRRDSSGTDLDDAEKDKARSMLAGVTQSVIRSPIDDDEDEDSNKKDTTPLQQSEGGNSRNVSGDFAVKQPDDEGSDEGQLDDEIYHGPPTTLLAELQLRKQRQKQRTQPFTKAYPNGIHSTLLEMDTVIQTEQKARKKGRTILAWEDPAAVQAEAAAAEDDEDVPLAMLFSKKAEENRPLGLMERRELEDNEPLSRRRERLQGRPAMPRASTMMHLSGPTPGDDDEGETLAQRVRKLKETTLPAARPVSGDFATEMMSQFGGDLMSDPKDKGKANAQVIVPSPGPEEEETLGQRRKRLQAEREARAREVGIGAQNQTQRPEPTKRRSMADLLQAHPSAGADKAVNYQRPVGGLLSLHETQARRSSTMINLSTTAAPFAPREAPRQSSGGFRAGMYNDGQGGIIPPAPVPKPAYHQRQLPSMGGGMFPQPSLGMGNAWANPYPMNMNMNMGYNPNQFQMQLGMMQQQMNMMAPQPLNQGQIDMVERWRQSVMQ